MIFVLLYLEKMTLNTRKNRYQFSENFVAFCICNSFNFQDKIKRTLCSLIVYFDTCSHKVTIAGKSKRHFQTRDLELMEVSVLTRDQKNNKPDTTSVQNHAYDY